MRCSPALGYLSIHSPPHNKIAPRQCLGAISSGADDEIRTRDPHLGKVMLYQLSHIRLVGQVYLPKPDLQPLRPMAQ